MLRATSARTLDPDVRVSAIMSHQITCSVVTVFLALASLSAAGQQTPSRMVGAPSVGNVELPATSPCSPGPEMEPRDYADAEFIGMPQGRRARMCYYWFDGRNKENLRFYPNGIFVRSGESGSGGFAIGGAVLSTLRGTYGFAGGNRLNLRIAYSGIGVTQSGRGAGSSNSLDVSRQQNLDREFVLPNCQRISLRDEAQTYQLGPPLRSGHPDHLILQGKRWERDSDCGDWAGWR